MGSFTAFCALASGETPISKCNEVGVMPGRVAMHCGLVISI